jgi:hypothetical protein
MDFAECQVQSRADYQPWLRVKTNHITMIIPLNYVMDKIVVGFQLDTLH